MDNTFICPFCDNKHTISRENIYFNCLGEFFLDWLKCNAYIQQKAGGDNHKLQHFWAVLKYHISHTYLFIQRKAGESLPPIDYKKVIEDNILPNPNQQVDDLITFLGKTSNYWGENIDINPISKTSKHNQLSAWVGAKTEANFLQLLEETQELGSIEIHNVGTIGVGYIELKLKGWEYFRKILSKNPSSKQIFMAMKFEKDAQTFVNTHLKHLTKELGFGLKSLDEIISKENLIDDKLRVEIKKSRLLICDLTHGNQGAYWEAGYAEGLGIPVLYICRKDVLNSKSKKKKPHFDVNHQEIFTWEKDNAESIIKFKQQLEAKIVLLTQ